MSDVLIVLAVLAVVVMVVSSPLRRTAPEHTGAADAELADLQAAREAKYHEIRDADLDHRTGKLSTEDHQAIDSQLRAEAAEILHALDRADGTEAANLSPR